MRTTELALRWLAYPLLALLGVGLGLLLPVEAQAATIDRHSRHECKYITCTDVSAQNETCPSPGWCRDTTTLGQFPKCMPVDANIDCDESSKWGKKTCGAGFCSTTNAPCSYVLNFCIP